MNGGYKINKAGIFYALGLGEFIFSTLLKKSTSEIPK